MPKNTLRIFDGASRVQTDSEGNQWIDVSDIARDPQVKTDLTRLHEGFLAEQHYRQSLKSEDAQSSAVEDDTTVTEEITRQLQLEDADSRREEPRNRFRENESG